MIDGVRAVADQRVERFVAGKVDRMAILRPVFLQCRPFGDPVREAHALAQDGNVPLVVEEIGIDARALGGVGRGKAHRAPAFRAQHAGVQREAVSFHLFAPVILQHGRDEMPLHVGAGRIRAHLPESARFGIGRRHDAGALAPVFDDRAGHARRPGERIADRDRAFGFPAGHVVDVILQAAAHGRFVALYSNAMLLEMVGRADPGEHEDLRRIEGAGRQDHALARGQDLPLAAEAAAPDRNAGDLVAIDDQPFDQRLGADIEIGRFAQRLDIGTRCGPALAIALGHLVKAEAFLLRTVEIGIDRQLQLRRRFDEGVAGGIGVFLVAHEQRTAVAVIFVRPALVGLGLLEIGQNVVVGPAVAAHLGPVVVIPAMAADIDHGVDGRGSAQTLAARLVADAPVQPLLRDRFVPVVRVLEQERHEPGRLHQHAVVAPAGFQQADLTGAVHGKPTGNRAARAAAADHDIVVLVHEALL